MHIPDHHPYPHRNRVHFGHTFYFGWLQKGLPYKKEAPIDQVTSFFSELPDSICKTRGSHPCQYCDHNPVNGNGEYWIRVESGNVWVAPDLVTHYIREHGYIPPSEIIDSIVKNKAKSLDKDEAFDHIQSSGGYSTLTYTVRAYFSESRFQSLTQFEQAVTNFTGENSPYCLKDGHYTCTVFDSWHWPIFQQLNQLKEEPEYYDITRHLGEIELDTHEFRG